MNRVKKNGVDNADKSRVREKQIEIKLVKEAKALGGIALKLVCPGFDGMPDRMVLFPGGHIGFVELKAPGQRPRPLQESRHRFLRKMGFKVYVVDSMEGIYPVLSKIGGRDGNAENE